METPRETTGPLEGPVNQTTTPLDVQVHHRRESSLELDSLDVGEMLLDSINQRREATGHKEAFALSRLALQMNQTEIPYANSQRPLRTSSPVVPLPENNQATAAHINGEDGLFVPGSDYLTLNQPLSDELPSLTDQQMALMLQDFNETFPIQSPSQGLPHPDPNASQTGKGRVTVLVNDGENQGPSRSPSVHQFPGIPDDTEDQECPPEWPEEELERSARADMSKAMFHAVERWYKGLDKVSIKDEICYEAAKQQEHARKIRVDNRKALEKQVEFSYSDLDEPDASTSRQPPAEQETGSSDKLNDKPRPKIRRSNRISAEEKRKSKSFGLDFALGSKTKRELPPKRSRKRKAEGFDFKPTPKKRSNRVNLEAKQYLEALLASTVIPDAHENASLAAIPDSVDKDKMKALTRLVASIPSADQDEAKSDKKKVLIATKKFTSPARSDGKLGWKLKGLNTSLYHYQLLGAAFMRDRENSPEGPFGGLLSDIMGFGKTIQALANIVDGKPPDPEDPVRTTLIIVPSQLVTHWKVQITKHCDRKAIGEVLIYKANSRLETLDTVGSLERYDVIITTYDEVRRSYPRIKVPDNAMSDDKIKEWWDESYETEVGPLHQIKFHRIILDEGHIIKNHLSSVSIAVRALTGHYKWIISGTPVHNYLEELYPLFDFLSVPRIGDVGHFMKSFCSDEHGHGRLVNLLRSFLFRRTHKSRLFSLPVIKLPDVGEITVRVKFCSIERELYNAISELFIENINGCARSGQPNLAQYRCFLSMILMLLKRLLSEGYLIKKLSRIAKETGDRDDQRIVLKIVSVRRNTTVLNDRENEDFGQCLEELRGDKVLHENENWDERLERTNCPTCEFVPVNPVITSCKHLYCEERYYSLLTDKSTALGIPICQRCLEPIEEAAYFEEQMLKQAQSATPTPSAANHKGKKPAKAKTTKKGPGSSMHEEGDADEDTDWIKACTPHMPSAKLTMIREILAGWLAEDTSSKVVIFTQFLDFVRILAAMCKMEGWPFACLTGKMHLAAREESMRIFSDKEGEVRILVASLKAGGIGLDLSAANKCILVDLWWNEAIQEQAFCRLFRIGQESTVQFVKLIVESSIDDYLLDLQTRKTAGITSTMGEDVLKDRDTIEDLLRMFAHVEKDSNGVFHLQAKTSSRDVKKNTGFRPSFGIF
ncbi:SNF2 family helicase [Aspergillus sclerotioniger CBS 115572]|uniref:SNF2 family helicase n=1 Tax=Aspergillus sclerotioniger CBS 115572 TaxID=1450535 RepID=A0A317XCP9_9EURO|nr:SNF2 family helicase [Aspergillus sclerotioniger CBS 115572]PWY94320.1 SNF2 family helicase [Aspergillus sclerotioniger CBS 115572]